MFNKWHVLFALLCFDKLLHSYTESETSRKIIRRQTATAKSCNNGWYPFGEMCYKMGGNKNIRRLPWEQASEVCRSEYNGKLVTIYSKEISDFIIAFFQLSVIENLWIGLNDRMNESVYTWDDGTLVTNTSYLNWAPKEPTGQGNEWEDCIELMVSTMKPNGTTGMWNDVKCDAKFQFVCQKEKGAFSEDYSDPRFCSSEVGGGWKKNSSCFNIINEEKTWSDAEEYCIQKFKGHLVTITDFTINIFLNYILQDQEKDMWIGIPSKKQYQQQWTSGWYVSYENWAEDETPDELDEGSCVARDQEGKWVTNSCNKVLPFACEYSTEKAPILKRTTEGTSCPDVPADWRDLGGDLCYYFDLKKAVTWYEANFLCMRRGGTLASILSQEENKILQNFINFMEKTIYFRLHFVHIGLYRHIQDEDFVWADGSPVDYINWGFNEPDNEPSPETEQCSEVKADIMTWHDSPCSYTRGYICSVLKVSSNQTIEQFANQTLEQFANQTIVHSSPCLSGFSTSVLSGVIIGALFVSILIDVLVFYFCFRKRIRKNSCVKLQLHDKEPRYRSEIIVNNDYMYATEI